MNTTRYIISLMSIFSFLFGGCSKKPASNFSIAGKELFARGWNESELKQIIGDFEQVYRDRLPPKFSAEIHNDDGGFLRVTFPADIEPRFFCWLINYVQYPKSYDLHSRRILVAGKATVTLDFLPSDESRIGKRIMFYIPANDKQYDVVFAQVDGRSYEYPFGSEIWRHVEDPRLPVGISDLK
jgi:hypothetical protein